MVTLIDRLLQRENYNEVEVMKDGAGTIHKYKMNPIYNQRPHITADNYFSGEHVLDYLGQRGYGMTCTCRRDRFPKGLKIYLHHEKLLSTDIKGKIMCYQNPIIGIKHVPVPAPAVANKEGMPAVANKAKAYTKTITSFHSTGATNLSGVNNLKSCELYVSKKERGGKDDK